MSKEKTKETKVPDFLSKLAKAIEVEGKSLDMRAVTLNSGERIRWAVSSGSLAIDLICGGGYGVGRFTSPFGPEASGKSTGACEAVAEALNRGIPCIYYDAENALDVSYLDRIIQKKTGHNLEYYSGVTDADGKIIKAGLFYYIQPTGVEHCFQHACNIADIINDIVYSKKNGGWCYLTKSEKSNGKDVYTPRKEEGNVSIFYIIDSLKALVPQDKREDPEKNTLAMQARALSDSFAPLVERMKKKRLCVCYTNQLRKKIGVMFGCLHADSILRFEDGSVHTIKEVVENKIKGKVLSFNEKNKNFEYKEIVDWFYNGEVQSKDDWITIRVQGIGNKNGIATVTTTLNHKFLTKDGWKEAQYITTNDKILTTYKKKINGTLANFLSGVFCGDSCLINDNRTINTYFKLEDSEHIDYNNWKIEKLKKAFNFNRVIPKRKDVTYVDVSDSSYELSVWKDKLGKRNPVTIKNTFNVLSLAILFMDDGHARNDGRSTACISFKRFKNNRDVLFSISDMIKDLGYHNLVVVDEGLIEFDREDFLNLSKDICKYIPPCMQYKLPEQFRGKYEDFELDFEEKLGNAYVPVVLISKGSNRKFREKGKYDICVGSNHNYMAGSCNNGILVHNSPDYEPCGDAAKYYSSLRINYSACATSTVDKDFFKTSGTDGEGKGQVDVEKSWDGQGIDRYRYAKIKTVKNKQFSPYQETFIRFRYEKAGQQGDGIDPSFDVYAYLYQTGQCSKKSGKGLSISLFGCDQDEPFPRKIAAYLGDLSKLKKNLEKAKEKESKQKTFDIKLTWQEFKELVENPERKQALYKLCKKQMETGFAWSLYFANKNSNTKESEDEEKSE